MKNKKSIIIYTDGACSYNPGPGGWGVVFVDDSNQVAKTLYGSEPNTTNNRMELLAIIEGLTFLLNEKVTQDVAINVFVDSKYVKDGITSWIKKWKINNWRTSSNSAVKNQDLWQRLDSLSNMFKLSWNWVKAHDTNTYNNMADSLARKGVEEIININ